MSKKIDVTEIVAQAYRQIGQPNIEGLVFICDSDSVFASYDKILGIEVFSVPFLNTHSGLLLGSKDCRWNTAGIMCMEFQKIMADLMEEVRED